MLTTVTFKEAKVKIRIRDNASDLYVASQQHHGVINWEWAEILGKIQGMVLEVETEYLFKDQFNTGPIAGVSEQGLRVMAQSVAEVIDDIRPSKMRCHWCGKVSDLGTVCSHCSKSEYLERLSPPYGNISAV